MWRGGSLVQRACAFIAYSMKVTQDFILQATNMQGLGTRLEGREMKSRWKEKKRGEGMREKESRKGSKEGREEG